MLSLSPFPDAVAETRLTARAAAAPHRPNRFATLLPAFRPLPSQRPHLVSGQIRSETR